MNEPYFANVYRQLCENLLAMRKAGDWKLTHPNFDEYVVDRWSISKSRAKLLCNFAKFCELSRVAGMTIPESPDNVAPILSMPQKDWLDSWGLVLSYAGAKPLNAKSVLSTLEHFGIGSRKKIPQHVLNGQRLRRASKTFAELEDGAKVAGEIGKGGYGPHWNEGVRVVIEADQARMDECSGTKTDG